MERLLYRRQRVRGHGPERTSMDPGGSRGPAQWFNPQEAPAPIRSCPCCPPWARGVFPCGAIIRAKSHRPASPQLERLGSVSGAGLFSWLCGTRFVPSFLASYHRECGSAALPRLISLGYPYLRACRPPPTAWSRSPARFLSRVGIASQWLWSRVNMAGTHGAVGGLTDMQGKKMAPTSPSPGGSHTGFPS